MFYFNTRFTNNFKTFILQNFTSKTQKTLASYASGSVGMGSWKPISFEDNKFLIEKQEKMFDFS